MKSHKYCNIDSRMASTFIHVFVYTSSQDLIFVIFVMWICEWVQIEANNLNLPFTLHWSSQAIKLVWNITLFGIIIIAWVHTQNYCYYNFELKIYRFGAVWQCHTNRAWISKSEWIYVEHSFEEPTDVLCIIYSIHMQK